MAGPNLLGALGVVLDASEAQVKFAILAGRFEDYRPVLKGSVLKTLRRAEDLHFSTEGDIFGDPWPPLAPSTLEAKERLGFGNRPILVRTGALRSSLTSSRGESIVRATRFALLFGTSIDYAVFHQQPDGPGAGIIPERQVIPDPLPAEVLDELRDNLRNWLIEGRIS